LLSALILIEYLWLPYPLQKVDVSPFYTQMALSPRKGAVLHIPFTWDNKSVTNLVAQTMHERRIAGGYLSTQTPDSLWAIRNDPVLSQLEGLDPRFSGALDRMHLLALDFDTAILHKNRRRAEWEALASAVGPRELLRRKNVKQHLPLSNEKFDAIRAAFEVACGRPVFEDDEIVVFYLDGADPRTGKAPFSR
jgi:hypothetical protein